MIKPTMWFSTRSNTNRAVQPQKITRSLKFWIKKVEELYYPCSENKGADQLCSYCTADLWLCFHLCKSLVFSCNGSNKITPFPECPSRPVHRMFHRRTKPGGRGDRVWYPGQDGSILQHICCLLHQSI